jgi:hypothetical protein
VSNDAPAVGVVELCQSKSNTNNYCTPAGVVVAELSPKAVVRDAVCRIRMHVHELKSG